MRENRHAAFDVAGAGNVAMVAGLRAIAKAVESPPAPTVRAPVLDPTCEGLGVKFPGGDSPTNNAVFNGLVRYPRIHAWCTKSILLPFLVAGLHYSAAYSGT